MTCGDIEDLHLEACKARQSFYTDPTTNLLVFTAHHLRQRPCCASGCRHCPHRPRDHVSRAASLLHGDMDDLPDCVDVLFWSGGKDSFLALRRLQLAAVRPVLLLTTVDDVLQRVAQQNIAVTVVRQQAIALQLPLLTVPVAGHDYVLAVRAALLKLRNNGVAVTRIAFGDLHLPHVRRWRDDHLASLDAQLFYPLWNVAYPDLLQELFDANVDISISAVDDVAAAAGVCVGDVFDRPFVNRLPKSIDLFGENGEFHTCVKLRA